jgi:hypothetical protein
MSDQDNSIIEASAPVETFEGPSKDWLDLHRTTAEEQENVRWVERRNHELVANRALKQTLGLDYDGYRTQLEAMSSDDRLDLIDKSPEEIAEHLNERAEAEREQEKRAEAASKEAENQVEANFAANETPQLREIRKSMRTSYQAAAALDNSIAELQRLNDLRIDPAATDWDKLPIEQWRAAREGRSEPLGSDIAALIQEKQARLQEAIFHQNAYHEGVRSITIARAMEPAPSIPIGQIVDENGQPVPLTRGDIAQIVQLERDQQNYAQRAVETNQQFPDWEEAAKAAARAGVDITAAQAQFIVSLPNGPDVAYHLSKNHSETRALARMNNQEAARELIRLSHQLARQSSSRPPTKTSAPKPPSPVGGSSGRGFDVSDESLSSDEWMRQRNEQVSRRRR